MLLIILLILLSSVNAHYVASTNSFCQDNRWVNVVNKRKFHFNLYEEFDNCTHSSNRTGHGYIKRFTNCHKFVFKPDCELYHAEIYFNCNKQLKCSKLYIRRSLSFTIGKKHVDNFSLRVLCKRTQEPTVSQETYEPTTTPSEHPTTPRPTKSPTISPVFITITQEPTNEPTYSPTILK